jgi:hypothetical protein
MKRILLVAVSSSALALGAPAIASAHHHHHARRHHAKHHAARARVLDFRASAPATRTTPGSPATPATPSSESVGTVTSFKEGVLIITLTSGTQVSGKVTEQTQIRCTSATPTTGGDDSDDESGSGEGDHSSSTDGSHGDAHAASNGDDSDDGPEGGQAPCTTAALVPGAMVREAELTIGSAGAVWDRIDLIQ